MYIYIYIYVHVFCEKTLDHLNNQGFANRAPTPVVKHWCEYSGVGRGDDTVGSPHRAQISQSELFEFILLSTFDKQFPAEHFEAAVSQSTVPSPPLFRGAGVRPNSVESPRGIFLAAAPHYRTRTLSKRLPKAKSPSSGDARALPDNPRHDVRQVRAPESFGRANVVEVSVKTTLSLREPWPCKAAAETPVLP